MMSSSTRPQDSTRGSAERARVLFRNVAVAGLLLGMTFAPASAGVATLPAFERLQTLWNGISDYSVMIDAHEVLGNDTADSLFHYQFKRPDHARLDVLKGNKSGSTMIYDGGDRVTAYKRSLSIFKVHGDVRDKDLTSLRGNGILSPNLGDLVACFAAHRDAMHETNGPVVDGAATDSLVLDYSGVTCPDDPAGDRGQITQDVLDVSHQTGVIVMRERYVGDQVVERWQLTDFKENIGLSDADLR